MPRSDFATSAEYHADAAVRAGKLLNDTIARIDAALSFMDQRKAAYLASIYDGLRGELLAYRGKALSFLGMPDNGGTVAIGKIGANDCGPRIVDLIRSVDFHANTTRYVPPALRDAGRAAA